MFYSDRPINSGNEDKLNRKGFARLLARTLVNLDSKDTFTVGLFGKWGCGKTSLVNMTLEEIENIQAEDELKKEIINGTISLVHGNKNRVPANIMSEEERQKIISLYKKSNVSIRKFCKFYNSRSYSCIYNLLKSEGLLKTTK